MEKKCISKLGCPLIVSDFHRETLRSLVGRKNEWNIFNFNTGQDNTAAGGRRKDEELTLNILIESDKVWIVECPKSIWEVKTAEWWPWKASNSMYIINRFIDLHDSTLGASFKSKVMTHTYFPKLQIMAVNFCLGSGKRLIYNSPGITTIYHLSHIPRYYIPACTDETK